MRIKTSAIIYPVAVLIIISTIFISTLKNQRILDRLSLNNNKSFSEITPRISPPLINPQYLNQDIVFHGSSESAKISLTFDADMTPGMLKRLKSDEIKSWYNESVIKVLEETNTPATLFLTGMWIETYPDISISLANNSLFELGNHSYSHPSFAKPCFGLSPISDDKKVEEITKTQQLLKDITGYENILFRFPGGCYTQKDLLLAKSLSVLPIQWNSQGPDSFNENTNQIVNNLKGYTKNGTVIVLHLNGNKNAPKTAEAISAYIPWAKAQGFTFVKLSDLLK